MNAIHRTGQILLAGFALIAVPAVAQVTFTIESTVGNPGDLVEVPVHIDSAAIAPETCVLFINYNSAEIEPFQQFYEFVRTDLSGAPIRDAEGNALITTSAVRPEALLTDNDKIVETQISSQGYIAVAILGIDTPPIPDGHLLTIGFRVKTGSGTITLDGDENFSSAVDSSANRLALTWEDGGVDLGCVPPAAPTGVNASTSNAEAVVVTWAASSVPGAQYRVYRSEQINQASAVPLGDGWQTATRFEDFSALAPVPSEDCTRPAPRITRYYYWVQVRDESACISEFSAQPAEGSRGEAKSLLAAAAGAEGMLAYALMALLLLGWRRRGTSPAAQG